MSIINVCIYFVKEHLYIRHWGQLVNLEQYLTVFYSYVYGVFCYNLIGFIICYVTPETHHIFYLDQVQVITNSYQMRNNN